MTTKLVEGGQWSPWSSGSVCYYFYVFTFFTFFKIQNVTFYDFLTCFIRLGPTRTMLTADDDRRLTWQIDDLPIYTHPCPLNGRDWISLRLTQNGDV